MGREFELKYRASTEIQSRIRREFDGFREISMETTYFDTPDGDLAARKITLRLRKENDETICTLKTPLPDGSRGEWECHATDIAEGLACLLQQGAPAEIGLLAQKGLIPVCGAKFVRLAATVETADGTADLALDHGKLLGGNKEMPLCEVEVELKTGSDAAAMELADTLALRYDLQPENKSKFRRAMLLAQGE